MKCSFEAANSTSHSPSQYPTTQFPYTIG